MATRLLAAEHLANLNAAFAVVEELLLDVISRRGASPGDFLKACQLLRRVGDHHEAALRQAITDRLSQAGDRLYEHESLELAEEVGVDPTLLHRRALLAILVRGGGESWAVRYLLGSEEASALEAERFKLPLSRRFGTPSRDATDPFERIRFWVERLSQAAGQRPELVKFIATAAGASPSLAERLSSGSFADGDSVLLLEVADVVRRRGGDTLVHEFARTFVRRWVRLHWEVHHQV